MTTDGVLFRAKVLTSGTTNDQDFTHAVDKTGSIKLSQVSYVGTQLVTHTEGCNSSAYNEISISSSGGEMSIRAPSKEAADSVAGFIQGLIQEIS